MLETIRQFAEEQLVNSGEADRRARRARPLLRRHAKPTCWPCGTARANARPTNGWLVELPNLRAAFRWTVDCDMLDTGATIAFYASVLGQASGSFEPTTWAEELVGPAKAADHRRLVQLYVMAAQCYATGRVDDAVGYIEVGKAALERGRYADVPFDYEAVLGTAYHLEG